jgi:RNA polymerase sigma factor (sigma-70 family)
VYVQDTLAICWKSEDLAAAPPRPMHSEGKAAARRRRQMERLAQRRPAAVEAMVQVDLALVLAIEQAQDDLMARVIERALEPPKPKGVTHAKLTEWFLKWRKPIRGWLRDRAGVPRGEIDDLAQEVFMRLMKYAQDTEVDNPQGYLFRIASNVAAEWRDRARVRYAHDPEWLDGLVGLSEDEPHTILEQEFESGHIQAAVDRLPPRQREVLLMHVNEGRTYKQIAADRDLTYRIVLRDLTRAYSTLRSELR